MQDFEDAKDKVMLGVERKSLVLSEDERRLTAFHEAGHTVVSLKTEGSDPIHKVTIIPRGRALGLMMSLPDKDRYGQTKEWLIGRLGIAFGGRVAEELVFGPNKVTTGAGSDIEQATSIARRMVTQFGMSEKVGMMAIGDREQEIFLGREFGQRREVSERTAEMVDDEVKHFLDEAHERARRILTEHRELLDRIANALLERETIDREDVDLLSQGKSLPQLQSSSTPPTSPTALSPKPDAAVPQRAPILGAPPAEPMGA
jgi:cell division protease FtsH